MYLFYVVEKMMVIAEAGLKQTIREAWLKILDGLLVMDLSFGYDEPDFQEALNTWRDFGTTIGLREADMRTEVARLQQVETGGLIGCSWVRCPLNLCDEVSTTREFLRCATCRKVRNFAVSTFVRLTTSTYAPGTVLYLALPEIVSGKPTPYALALTSFLRDWLEGNHRLLCMPHSSGARNT